ncbi:DUF2207 domain-containing protein [Aeromicrobium yanjiei]|uniref:DUF2207 domain-containing protein n=1 Tax=Aeromicrobium yanjiei TaxID=2662028 RepID=A0A5Q2MNQ0_9ACTN|nr:DUF2207 domain-containing protein [Aeromicrobium yanjiei]QGG41660.1 DUF2207 domain-containing protein [Aeromicrobium yanjiei]
MLRPLLRVLALAATVGLLVVPVLASSQAPQQDIDPRSGLITDFRGDYVLSADGTLAAKETVTTETREGQPGVARSWDLRDPFDSHVRLVPENIAVEVDGRSQPVELQWQQGRRVRVAQIADAVTAGTHTYTVRYTVDGVLSSSDADSGTSREPRTPSVLRWDVVPRGWDVEIKRSTAHLTLPAGTESVRCATGRDPDTTCDITGTGSDRITITTGALPARTPVTLRAGLPVEAPGRVTAPWPVQLDRALGRSVLDLAALLVAAFALGGIAYALDRRSRHAAPHVILTVLAWVSLIALLAIGILAHPPVTAYLLPVAGCAVGGAGLLTRRPAVR